MNSAFKAMAQTDSEVGTLVPVQENENVRVLRIPSDQSTSEAVRYTSQSGDHLVLICEKESSVNVEIVFSGSTVLEIFLEDDAKLQLICLQMNDETVQITQRSKIGNRANLYCQNITLGKAVEQSFISTLTGEHAKSDIDWIFYSKGDEKLQLRATNTFEGREGGGEITMQGVAEQKAHVLCDGMIKIGPGGGGTDTYLTESVLMLDPTAKVDAIPGLEIKTNDVKASHSATVSRVTPEDLYYFSARGIPHTEAKKMYILGFLSAQLDAITSQETKDVIVTALLNKYSN